MLQTLLTQMHRNPVDQNQDQDQDQVPTGQVPLLQPVPAQLAPAGIVPVPQICLSKLDM